MNERMNATTTARRSGKGAGLRTGLLLAALLLAMAVGQAEAGTPSEDYTLATPAMGASCDGADPGADLMLDVRLMLELQERRT